MKKILTLAMISIATTACTAQQFNLNRALQAGQKAVQALTLSDAQIIAYTQEFIRASDAENPVAAANDPYAVRLNRIAGKINGVDGINIKVYKTSDVNAFACADGSVRVFAGLMDIMTDEEVLGVIGHEIGHVKNQDTKDAFKRALMTSAAKDAIASTGATAARLSDSQLGALGESFLNANYSQKQEFDADNYGYDFLKAHGVNPWAMALSFEKLAQMQGGAAQTPALQQLFSTHPDLAVRTRAMADRATADGFARPANQ